MEGTSTSQGVEALQKIAEGWTSTIYRIPLEHKVVKVLDKQWVGRDREKEMYERELTAYQRMSARDDQPNSVLKFFGPHPTIEFGMVLELAERSSLDRYLWKHHCRSDEEPPPEGSLLFRWAEQLAEALSFVHSCNIIHCDIYVANCFLDEDLNLKLGDFGACALDGGRSMLTYRRSHQLWEFDEQKNAWKKAISIASEIFAHGCALYHMETCEDPFSELNDQEDREEIARRIQNRDMPSLEKSPVLGRFIAKCWQLEYTSMSDILQDIQTVRQGSSGEAHL